MTGSSLLAAEGLSKTFGGVRALRSVSLEISRGEVRALLGQNGCGKSTLIKILDGFHAPDPGARVSIDGTSYEPPFGSLPGLGVCHQHLGLEPSMSVVDNFMLGESRSLLGKIGWRRERGRVEAALAHFGLQIDVTRSVHELASTERAVIAIARAFDRIGDGPGKLLILDEPTVSLEQSRSQELFAAIESLRERECGVLFVSHHVPEVMALCDTVSVLRNGELVAEGEMQDFTEAELIKAIVGRDLGDLYPPPPPPRTSPVILSAERIGGATVREVSFDVHEGEIVGVTGLAGMGQDELAELLYGAKPLRCGEIRIHSKKHQSSPKASLEQGMIFLPADRAHLGGDPAASLTENLTIPIAGRYFKRGRRAKQEEREDVAATLRRFDVRPADPDRKLGELSGGNQQKALIGKWLDLYGNARILLLHEPTQGVDLGAKQEIFRAIADSAGAGVGIVYISNEAEDLAHLCDRVLVMRHGLVTSELPRTSLDDATITAHSLAS